MVYRCVDRAGAVSLQSQACSPDQRTTRAIPAPPDIEPIRSTPALRPASSNDAGDAGFSRTRDYEREQRQVVCAMARRERDATLERVGLRRTYALLQRLDAMVNAACKGV